MYNTKKLTEASLMTAIFIVITMISIGTGIGYGMYLDYIVPIFYIIVYHRCGMRYSFVSAFVSVLIILFVLGNVGTAIWASQGIIIGLFCGYMIGRKTNIMDDMMICTIVASVVMIFVDVYASQLIGFSIIEGFRESSEMAMDMMMKVLPTAKDIPVGILNQQKELIFYMCIALIPLGTIIVVYIIGIFAGERLKSFTGIAREKYIMMRNFRITNSMLFSSSKLFYPYILFIGIFSIMKSYKIEIPILYLDVILNCIYYNGILFMIRESIVGIQGYMIIKGKKAGSVKLFGLLAIFMMITAYRLVVPLMIMYFVYIDISYKIRKLLTDRLNEVIADRNTEMMKQYFKK